MKPNYDVKMDKKAFDILKNTMKSISVANRGRNADPAFATDIPTIVGLKLTNRCNLRCRHCYEWNEQGYHKNMENSIQKADLDFDIVEKILRETQEAKSNLYLWGGEPLYYSHFDKIADLLEKDERITAICTNGVSVQDKMDSLLKIGQYLELLIALEGFDEENDAIRGTGTYKKVISAIDSLMELREKGVFQGKVSIHTVMNDRMIGKLYDYAEFMEQKGVGLLILCFPWYISDESSYEMDRCFEQNFKWLDNGSTPDKRSWHAFKYNLDSSYIDALLEDLNRINQRVWKMKILYQPALEFGQVRDFILGKHVPAQNRTRCLSLSTRMDVLPDGSVSSCKHFPEFSLGNLKDRSVHEVWNCSEFRKVREILSERLMPVCSKCNNLYLHGC